MCYSKNVFSFQCVSEAVKIAQLLIGSINNVSHDNFDKKTINTISTGIYAVLWNAALHQESNKNPDHLNIYKTRVTAITFLLYTNKDISAITEKVDVTLSRLLKFILVDKSLLKQNLDFMVTQVADLMTNMVTRLELESEDSHENICLTICEVYLSCVKSVFKTDFPCSVDILAGYLQSAIEKSKLGESCCKVLNLNLTLIQVATELKICGIKNKKTIDSVQTVNDLILECPPEQLDIRLVQSYTTSCVQLVSFISGETVTPTGTAIFTSLPLGVQSKILPVYDRIITLYKHQLKCSLECWTPKMADQETLKLQVLAKKAIWWKNEALQLYLVMLKNLKGNTKI